MPRLPFDGSPRVTCDHACHQARKPPSGGEDFGMALGTNLYAPFDGSMKFYDAVNGGWGVSFTPSDPRLAGLTVQLMHLSAVIGLTMWSSRSVREGEHAAESGGAKGAPGAGNSTGPHLHGQGMLNGKRISLTEAIKWAIEQTNEEDDMAPVKVFKRSTNGDEWMRVAEWLDGGYEVTLDPVVAVAWERMYARGSQSADPVDRASYITIQKEAKSAHEQYVASTKGQGVTAPTPSPIEPPVAYEGTITLTPKEQ